MSNQQKAKFLNNRASTRIQSGDYDAAINDLVGALNMASAEISHTQAPCPCENCSLDHCMAYSQHVLASRPGMQSNTDSYMQKNGGGYLYRRPIFLPSNAMSDAHEMGFVLPMILTFNLALSHHLKCLQDDALKGHSLERVLRLYELLFRWQIEVEAVQVDSVAFTLVISNNLGEIHRVLSNQEKHQLCLEHLLKTVMYMVDCHEHERSGLDMEGFLENTSQLFRQHHCAQAAYRNLHNLSYTKCSLCLSRRMVNLKETPILLRGM
eukprot:Nitzschia sp. Nitz4//scaffold100_size80364//35197//35994//NITZ4_005343-RA/size80364-processed-gene-0.53-mRNA-1//-1//CDS//3329532091//2533//frame0